MTRRDDLQYTFASKLKAMLARYDRGDMPVDDKDALIQQLREYQKYLERTHANQFRAVVEANQDLYQSREQFKAEIRKLRKR